MTETKTDPGIPGTILSITKLGQHHTYLTYRSKVRFLTKFTTRQHDLRAAFAHSAGSGARVQKNRQTKRAFYCAARAVRGDRIPNHYHSPRTRRMRADERSEEGLSAMTPLCSSTPRTRLHAHKHAGWGKLHMEHMHNSHAKAGPSGQNTGSTRYKVEVYV